MRIPTAQEIADMRQSLFTLEQERKCISRKITDVWRALQAAQQWCRHDFAQPIADLSYPHGFVVACHICGLERRLSLADRDPLVPDVLPRGEAADAQ